MDDEPIEFLVSRRSKRSTAGNRMQAALAEMAAENLAQDVEDDNDFTVVNDEQDVFESDFESTDEEGEAEKEGEEAGEQMVHEEECRERKAARSRLEKATAAAHARNKATFNPQAQPAPPKAPPKPKPHPHFEDLSEDLPVASTSAAGGDSSLKRKRKSLRTQTVLNTTATVKRLKEIEHNRALAPKKAKIEAKTYTQAELIARALDNEEGNIREHRDYLKNEEEKRKQARVVRATVKGPLLRWVSKVEEEKVVVKPPSPPPPPPPPPKAKAKPIPPLPPPPVITPAPTYTLALPRSLAYPPGSFPVSTTYYSPQQQHQLSSSSAYTQVQPYNSTFIFQSWPSSTSAASLGSTSSTMGGTSYPVFPQNYAMPSPPPPPPPVSVSAALAPPPPPPPTVPVVPDPEPLVVRPPTPPPPAESEPEIKFEKVGKNYVVHAHDSGISNLSKASGSGSTGTSGSGSGAKKKPTWNETMEAMFGNEVKWDEVKVYTSKNRPLARPVQSCPITGKTPAPYKEPISNVPFGDVAAYQVLMELLDHKHVWSPKLGRYVGKDEEKITEAEAEGERVGGSSGWPRREEEEEAQGEGEGGEKAVEVEVVRKERLGGRLRAL